MKTKQNEGFLKGKEKNESFDVKKSETLTSLAMKEGVVEEEILGDIKRRGT